MTTPWKDSEAARASEEWTHALNQLPEEGQQVLALLRLMGSIVDPRYEMKGIRALVARALVDPAFRSSLLDDADAALAGLRGRIELPENVHIRCVENTADYLTIVLPPPAGAPDDQTPSVRDFIFSRTSPDLAVLGSGVDDNDVLPAHFDLFTGDNDGFHLGDPSRDG